MPLMNTPLRRGHCEETIQNMPAGPRREIALAEYHYFSGQAEKAMQETERYLTAGDWGHPAFRRAGSFAYSCLTMGRIDHARRALREIQNTLGASGRGAPMAGPCRPLSPLGRRCCCTCRCRRKCRRLRNFCPCCPPGLRAFALYVQAHYLYLKEDYANSAGMVEATLSMGAAAYPIPALYLHLVAVMDYMSLKQTDRARTHLLAAWELARPDDLIEAFGEHHGLLGGHAGGRHQTELAGRFQTDYRHHLSFLFRLA